MVTDSCFSAINRTYCGFYHLFPNQTTTSLFLGITVTITGLIIGVLWATKQWKEPGTIWFMSRIISTPKLDNEDEKINNDKQTMMTNKKASANN